MKKFCFILSALLLIILAGCGQQKTAETIAETTAAVETAEMETVPSELEDSMILLYAENEDYIPIFMDAPPEELWPALAK